MAAKTPNTTTTNNGYVDPLRGIRGHHASDVHASGTTDQREGLRHTVWFFGPSDSENDVDDTDTWTSGIPGIAAVAWQASRSADEVSALVTDKATGEITFGAASANSEGWLHVWSRG